MATFKLIYKPLRVALCAAFLGAAFTACSNSEADYLSTSEDAKVPLSISAAIQSGTEARKAGYDATTFATGDEIGLYILSTDASSAYSSNYTCYNVRATYNGSSWTLDNDVYLYEDNAYVIAYYPYSESFGNSFPDKDENPLNIDITPTDNEQTDVLTSAGVTVSRESSTANLTFDHVLTRVILSVGLSGDIETASLTSAAISGSKLYSNAGLYLSDGSFTASSTSSTADEFTQTLDATLDTSTRQDIDFLITSQSSTTLEATLVIDSISYTVDLTTDSWQAGYQYTYLINVVRTEEEEEILLEVESSSYIDGWTDQGTVEEIDVTYQTESSDSSQNEYEAVDLGLSVKWATCNVGASSPEEYGNYYAWGEIETKDEYTEDNSVTYGVEMSDFSGDAEYDAATANWGGSWRMPTSDEMEELVDNCTWEWTTLNDVNGYLVTGNNDNSIFFPAAGYCTGSKLHISGNGGHYWVSTPEESSTYFVYILYFTSGRHDVRDGYYRYYGRSVRPVTE